MIKRSTWIVLILLAIVLIVFLLVNKVNSPDQSNTTTTPLANDNYLITSNDGQLQILKIHDEKNNIFRMERDTAGTWKITQPVKGLADQASAEAAATQVTALKIVNTLDYELKLADAGLDSPKYTLELTFFNGLQHTIEIGSMTAINTGYYVRFDNGPLYVISSSGIEKLELLLTTPPYLPTATMEPQSSTETPTSTPLTVTP